MGNQVLVRGRRFGVICHLSCALSESVKRLERMGGGCRLCGNCESFSLSEHRPQASLPAGSVGRGAILTSLPAPQAIISLLQWQVHCFNPFPRVTEAHYGHKAAERSGSHLTEIYAQTLTDAGDWWQTSVSTKGYCSKIRLPLEFAHSDFTCCVPGNERGLHISYQELHTFYFWNYLENWAKTISD